MADSADIAGALSGDPVPQGAARLFVGRWVGYYLEFMMEWNTDGVEIKPNKPMNYRLYTNTTTTTTTTTKYTNSTPSHLIPLRSHLIHMRVDSRSVM